MFAGQDASALLRPGLLEGTSLVVVGCSGGERRGGDGDGGCAGNGGDGASEVLGEATLAAAVQGACASLGAAVGACVAPAVVAGTDAEGAEAEIDAAIAAALGRAGGRADALVVDADALFERPGQAGERLQASMLACWAAVRSLATRAFIGERDAAGRPGGGRIVLIAPRADTREHAGAAAAGLENLARTLSIEWARYAVTAVALAPGAATHATDVGALGAYLLSPAGAYFSGCLLDLRSEPAASSPPTEPAR